MAARKIKKRYTGLRITALILCAMICRILGQYAIWPLPLGLVHTVICIGLCMGWGVSINRRIVQRTVRKYMLGVSWMTVVWFVIRSIKYYFVVNLDISRYLWYAYYVPMLCVPLFVLLVALSLCKPENYRPSKWVWLSLIPCALFLFVLTNDLHQLIFVFPEGAVWSDDDYSYGKIYYLIWVWELVCILASFVIMLLKCRLSRRKQYLPALLILLLIFYGVIYIAMGVKGIIKLLAGDMVMVCSLLIIGILESAIRCGLIQTNSGYAELFEVGTFGAQIADGENQILYTSANAPKLSAEEMNQARNGTFALDKNTLLKAKTISGGHVFWQEDITDLIATLEKMEENRAELEKSNHIEEENLRVKREIFALREKNRLYDLLQSKIAPKIALLDRLFSNYNEEKEEAKRRNLLGKIAFVGTYIKRCGNLLFIGERSESIDTLELSLCMEESFTNLSLMGIECAMDIPGSYRIDTKDAIYVYDLFEKITEEAIDRLHSVWLKARILKDSIVFHLEVECDIDLAHLSPLVESCREEDGIWSFTLRVGKVGEV